MIGPLLPRALPTPATLVFADRLERNLVGMAAMATSSGMALRPHAKTHKCVEIARRQMALGARGLTVATVGEAEILTSSGGGGGAASGVDDVFVAYPLWPSDDLVARLRALADRVRVTVGADNPEAVLRLAPLAGRVRIMVEVDCGWAEAASHRPARPSWQRWRSEPGWRWAGCSLPGSQLWSGRRRRGRRPTKRPPLTKLPGVRLRPGSTGWSAAAARPQAPTWPNLAR